MSAMTVSRARSLGRFLPLATQLSPKNLVQMSNALHREEEKKIQEPAAYVYNELLRPYNLFGWRPSIDLSVDANYMEMVLLLTRNSICMSGYMACVIANPREIGSYSTVEELERSLFGAMVGVSTNKPLFSELDSDVHAEIGALGVACRRGNATEGCTAYITMPPCKRCFAALLSSGIKRIVARRSAAATILPVAVKHGIEMVELAELPEQTTRVDALTQTGEHDGERSAERQAKIEEQRKRRREERGKKKAAKRRRQQEDPSFQKRNP